MSTDGNLSKSNGFEMKKVSEGHCKYLGLLNDPGTIFNFPSMGNYCYRCKQPSVPLLEYQHKMCLTKSFNNCTVFSNEKVVKLPRNLSEPTKHLATNRKLPWIIGGVAIIAVISFIILITRNKPTAIPDVVKLPLEQSELTTDQLALTENSYHVLTPNQDDILTATSTDIITDVPTDAPNIPTVEVVHKLDFPIGSDQKFVVHQVLDGESVEQYAIQYNTNKETILDINYFLPIPLWINWLIIVPVDLIDAGDLPTFEAYVVIDDSITVAKLAEKFSIDPAELGYYNGVKSDYILKSGDWLLIPREGYFLFNQ